MSFRLHRGPKLLTLFHDSTSPSSQRILSLLQSRIKPIDSTSSSQSNTDQDSSLSPANEYLKTASSTQNPSSTPFELEVVDRKRATPDQWNTIGGYLSKNRRSQVEELKGEQGAILVNWDDGQALQTEEAVQSLLDTLSTDQKTKQGDSWWKRLTSES